MNQPLRNQDIDSALIGRNGIIPSIISIPKKRDADSDSESL
jgi:hypothetical protein